MSRANLVSVEVILETEIYPGDYGWIPVCATCGGTISIRMWGKVSMVDCIDNHCSNEENFELAALAMMLHGACILGIL